MRENFNSLAVYEVRRLSVMVKKKKGCSTPTYLAVMFEMTAGFIINTFFIH